MFIRRTPSIPTPSDHALVARIRLEAAELVRVSEQQLRVRSDQLRESAANQRSPARNSHQLRRSAIQSRLADVNPELLVQAFALVNEAARRVLSIEFYGVQLLAGLSLVRGTVAEMQTGEGKTFVAALPAFVHALAGHGVHVMTSNAYLAGRDCEQLRPVYELLGLTVGLLPEQATEPNKRAAYSCDITYGAGYEFGFDYLRDQLTLRRTSTKPLGLKLLSRLRADVSDDERPIQRSRYFAIVDEIDNVLIDDANSPLVLSDQVAQSAADESAHLAARAVIGQLEPERDYLVDHASNVRLTKHGAIRIHSGCESLPKIPLSVLLRPWQQYVEQALRAEFQFRRDRHYVVEDGEVRIVDQSTGRIFTERTWQDGLHQAVEAKEGLQITAEKQPIARITKQRFFRLYDGLCGMTGTAEGSEHEFQEFYGLPTIRIPLFKPSQRQTLPTRYFADADAKLENITREVCERHPTGQPLLVGTASIADSERLAERLTDSGVAFQLLNGRQDADEADVIARAGQVGAVTIATNMAGRGTDIRPSAEAIARGGLHVIATQRHDSARIDRQLAGRAARQGDVGSNQFFVSADDELMHRHGHTLQPKLRSVGNGRVSPSLDKRVQTIQQHADKLSSLYRRQLFEQDQQRDALMEQVAG